MSDPLLPTLKEFLELGQGLRRVEEALAQEWHDLVPAPRLVVAEGYMQRQLVLHFHFQIRGPVKPNPAHFCAVFKRKELRGDNLVNTHGGRRSVGGADSRLDLPGILADRSHDRRVAVLIHDPKAVKNPKRMQCIVVTSVVRLQRLDDLGGLCSHTPHLLGSGTKSPAVGATMEVTVLVGINGKLGPGCRLINLADVQKLYEVVERRARLVHDVSNEDSEANGREGFQFSEAMNAIAGLRVGVLNDVIHLAFVTRREDVLDFSCEGVQMFAATRDPLLAGNEPFAEKMGHGVDLGYGDQAANTR